MKLFLRAKIFYFCFIFLFFLIISQTTKLFLAKKNLTVLCCALITEICTGWYNRQDEIIIVFNFYMRQKNHSIILRSSFPYYYFQNSIIKMVVDWNIVKEETEHHKMTKNLRFLRFIVNFAACPTVGTVPICLVNNLYLINFSQPKIITNVTEKKQLFVPSEIFFFFSTQSKLWVNLDQTVYRMLNCWLFLQLLRWIIRNFGISLVFSAKYLEAGCLSPVT